MGVEYEFLQRMILSIGIGGLIGLEREFTGKQRTTGIRSFALMSLIGCMSALLSKPILFEVPAELAYLPYIGFVMAVVYSFLVFYFISEKKETIGITTTLALPLTYLLGMLVGFGYLIEPIIAAVLVTILLYARRYSHMFVEHLTEEEIADALQFAIILFIVYPLLPSEPIVIFGTELLLRRLVEIIVLFSLISFAGFLAIRLRGTKALPITGFFAGFVSSLGVVSSFSNYSKKRGADTNSLASGIFTANLSSIFSDVLIIAFISPALVVMIAPSLILAAIPLFLAALLFRTKVQGFRFTPSQPFSVIHATKFGFAFFALTLLINAVPHLGLDGTPYTIYVVSFLGGFVSVTPVAVSLALGAGTTIPYEVASRSVLLAIIAGLLAKSGIILVSASPQLRSKAMPVLLLVASLVMVSFMLL